MKRPSQNKRNTYYDANDTYYDAKHGAGLSFKLNALVPKKDFRRPKRKGGKLDPRWLGPYRISGVLGKGLYSLSHCKDGHIVKCVNGMHPNIFHVSLPYSLEITPPPFCWLGLATSMGGLIIEYA